MGWCGVFWWFLATRVCHVIDCVQASEMGARLQRQVESYGVLQVKCGHESPLVRALVFAASASYSAAAADDGELHRITASANSYFFAV